MENPNSGTMSNNSEREQRILDATARLILRYGYDKTTVSDIAREAHVSKGAVYLHWKSKDDLLDALIWRESLVVMDEWVRLMTADPAMGSIGSVYKNTLLALKKTPILAALMAKDRQVLGTHFLKRNPEFMREKFNAGGQLLHKMREVGAIREEFDVEVVSYLLNVLSYGLLSNDEILPPERTPSFERIIGELGKLLDHALTPAEGVNRESGKQVVEEYIAQFDSLVERFKDRSD